MDSYNRQLIGKRAELEACKYLQAQGLRLLQQNYFCRYGEIDLIMQDREHVVFVEVRSRNRVDYGTALESVTRSKIKKLIRTATHYLQHKKWLYTVNSRFDIIAIHPVNGEMQLDWVKDAFGP